MFFLSYIVWDVSPIIVKLGPLQLRYYSLLFVAALLLGFYVWMAQAKRAGIDEQIADRFLLWGILGVVLGARLGHCFFYEPSYYLSHPIEILKVWKGGLASHGAAIGLLIAFFGYSKKYNIPFLEITDRLTFGVGFAATFVRLGNFFNSEIVGRVTHVPWAVKFPRYYAQTCGKSLEWARTHLEYVQPRHPSQIYEALYAAFILLILFLVDKKLKEKRPIGLLSGILLTLYFMFRFLVEFVKEYQSPLTSKALCTDNIPVIKYSSALTMGQYLSIPFFVAGLIILYFSLKGKFEKYRFKPQKAQVAAAKAKTKKSKKKK